MIELTNKKFEIKKIKDTNTNQPETEASKVSGSVMTRPEVVDAKAVSYTHLTLPTILLV